jgi:hypothetical protein
VVDSVLITIILGYRTKNFTMIGMNNMWVKRKNKRKCDQNPGVRFPTPVRQSLIKGGITVLGGVPSQLATRAAVFVRHLNSVLTRSSETVAYCFQLS